MNLQRLDKIIATAQNISRAAARKEILRGKVAVNGATVRDIGLRADCNSAVIEYCGQAVNYKQHIYIMINKPKGILSASNDKSRTTVVDIIPDELKRPNLFPVGRLDKDTTGLLLITDDGDFAHMVISPKKNIPKCYLVTLDGTLTDDLPELFAQGITLADGAACKPAGLEILSENTAKITITEGKYHQIKRMFGTVGLGVNDLCRISIGNLTLPENLAQSECKELTQHDISKIFDN